MKMKLIVIVGLAVIAFGCVWVGYRVGEEIVLRYHPSRQTDAESTFANVELTDTDEYQPFVFVDPKANPSSLGEYILMTAPEVTVDYLVACYIDDEFVGGIKIIAPGELEFEGDWEEFIRIFNVSLR